jgi:hypothetical protein
MTPSYLWAGKRPNLSNAFYQWCEIHGWPSIRIQPEGKRLHVKMDILPIEKELSSWSQELIRVTHDYAAGPHSAAADGPIYSYLSNVNPEWASFVAASYVAIYWLNSGEPTELPPHPPVPSTNPLLPRLEEAKRLRYARTHTVRDALAWRWQTYCAARELPYLHLHEARKGRATLEVTLPTRFPLTDGMQEQIRRAAQEADVCTVQEYGSHPGTRWSSLTEHGLMVPHSLPIDDALFFMERVVHILEQAGYFASREQE